jgi:C-22 sterol desaturase
MKKILGEDNFVFSFGDLHKTEKSEFIGILSKKNVEKYSDRQLEVYQQLVSTWNTSLPDKQIDKMHYSKRFKWMNLYTFFQVFFSECLDPKHYQEVATDLEVLTCALQLVNFPISFPGSAVWKAIRARKHIVGRFLEAVKVCRQKMKANIEMEESIMLQLIRGRFSIDEINKVDEVSEEKIATALFVFIFASQDVLTSGLTWVISQLSKNQKLQQEIFEIPTHLKDAVLESMIKETIRT